MGGYKMEKDGKREGAGRKAKGITKKVSLTLSEDIWTEIEQYDNVACFIKSLVEDRDYMKQ